MIERTDPDKAIPGKSYEAKNRRLQFSGAMNFRDLGGYPTLDGRTVRWGRLYRSDYLKKTTKSDLAHLADLHIARMIDFRADAEREKKPDRLPADSGIQLVALPILDSSTKVGLVSRLQFVKDSSGIDPIKSMLQTYTELATRFTPQMSRFIHELISVNGQPVLFHCTAGKDRTGFGAALILRILGVPPGVVMEDYLLSNRYRIYGYRRILFVLRLIRGKKFTTIVKGFLEVQPAYLSAAFEAIEREHGSFENYLLKGLGLTGQDIDLLRDIYLE
jgi:protein-tyrosine phosphatase